MNRTLGSLARPSIVIALAALIGPEAHAQCANAREFAGFGGMVTNTTVIRIDTNGLRDSNLEVASFWVTSDSTINSGGPHFGTPSLCPSQGGIFGAVPWWQQGTSDNNPPPFRGIRGFVASPGCEMTLCPPDGASLTVVVEDITADGKDAGFIAYTVDETPPTTRWWDHGRTEDDVVGLFTHTMQRFPKITVTYAYGPAPFITIGNNYADLRINFHGVSGPNNTPLSATAAIASYDVMKFFGQHDPGRLRSAWTLLKTIPYEGVGIVGDQVQVPCPDTTGDSFLALGVTYKGGAGPPVKSIYVGRSISIECNPNIADPEQPKPKLRPAHKKPLSASGR